MIIICLLYTSHKQFYSVRVANKSRTVSIATDRASGFRLLYIYRKKIVLIALPGVLRHSVEKKSVSFPLYVQLDGGIEFQTSVYEAV